MGEDSQNEGQQANARPAASSQAYTEEKKGWSKPAVGATSAVISAVVVSVFWAIGFVYKDGNANVAEANSVLARYATLGNVSSGKDPFDAIPPGSQVKLDIAFYSLVARNGKQIDPVRGSEHIEGDYYPAPVFDDKSQYDCFYVVPSPLVTPLTSEQQKELRGHNVVLDGPIWRIANRGFYKYSPNHSDALYVRIKRMIVDGKEILPASGVKPGDKLVFPANLVEPGAENSLEGIVEERDFSTITVQVGSGKVKLDAIALHRQIQNQPSTVQQVVVERKTVTPAASLPSLRPANSGRESARALERARNTGAKVALRAQRERMK